MATLLDLAGCAAACGGAALAAYWSFGLARIARTVRTLPTPRDGVALARASPPGASVCVIVPAHNERAVIAGLIATLRAQDHPNLRVVLALDRCTDGTEEVARGAIGGDPRFAVVRIDECPAGWSGKVHAAYRGVHDGDALNSDYILFADADTLFDPRLVSASVALASSRGLDFMSLVSTLTHGRWFERAAQPAAGLELMRQYPLLRANLREGRRAFANGQFMMFTRDAYVRCGQHWEVRGELLEDIRFARVAEYFGMTSGVYLADGMLVCRMYHSWAEFRRGWKRIYTEAANRRAGRLLGLARRTRAVDSLLPMIALAAVVLGALGAGGDLRPAVILAGAAGLIAWTLAMLWVVRLGHGPWWTAWLMPVGSWLVGGIMREAARDLRAGRPTEWAGMTYARDVR